MKTNACRFIQALSPATLIGGLLVLSGCAGLDQYRFDWPGGDGPQHGSVAEVASMWADGIDVRGDPAHGGVLTPGFAGRVYLFGPNTQGSMAADGTFTVQLFDDMQPPSNPPAPREVWFIDQESLQRICKKDALGWGYDLWLPWGNFSSKIRKVSLVVIYKSKDGKEVWSGSTLITIPDQHGKPHHPNVLQETSRMNVPAKSKTGT